MTPTRVALLTGGTALAAAWISSAASTVPAVPAAWPMPAVVAQQAGPTPLQLDLAQEVTRLTARLERAPRPRFPGRNPFTLDRRERPVAAPTAPPAASMPAPPTSTVAPGTPLGRPTVALAGIGSERTPTGMRYTAILSVSDRVILAHVGDDVIGRFQVRQVSSEAVELLDHHDDVTLHLTLP